jgi:GH24 family phage-related lysozyme (muramidase)
MTRHVNEAGLDLIKSSEGCKLEAYLDGGGVPTIGYGSTKGIKMGYDNPISGRGSSYKGSATCVCGR